MRISLNGIAGLLIFLSGSAGAEPLSLDKVPEPLKPWVQWVLDGNEEARCPSLPGGAAVNGAQRPCFWPARLELALEDRQGRFKQDWQVFRDGWVPLPGDAKRWPQDVQVDGRPAAAVLKDGAPKVRLSAGSHSVSGEFRWDAMPELLQIPRDTGLVGLSLRGVRVKFPNHDEEGRLWLQKAAAKDAGESRLEVVVHRKVVDEIPLQLITDIELKVSGKNREVLLGKALPKEFVPMALTGPLPARLERDGRLRVQARPGDWRIELTARHEGPAAALSLPVPEGRDPGPWDEAEVWVFDARPNLRLVDVGGASSVDPQQTELPGSWRHLPAYLMRPGETLTLAERRRGDADPVPDQLNLNRVWWLDFDGGGYSVRDEIGGTLRRSWRMEMDPQTRLGRVAVGGSDQFITSLKPEKDKQPSAGIEIRQGAVRLDADSRVEGRRFSVPAVGWLTDFQQVRGRLNLPPGWRLIHAGGVDDASPTWVTRWTLFDIFILLMIALPVGKLWGTRWGALALVALALSYHEFGAPKWVWVVLLVCEALSRALPEGKVRKAAQTCRFAFRLGLAVILVPFFLTQVRTALYPQLERGHYGSSGGAFSFPGQMGAMAPGGGGGADQMQAMQMAESEPMDDGAVMEESAEVDESRTENEGFDNAPAEAAIQAEMKFAGKRKASVAAVRGMAGLSSSLERSRHYDKKGYYGRQLTNLYAPDPKSLISTGPGLPTWGWNSVSLSWRGPVKQGQRMRLFLVGPFGNFVLTLLRLTLILLLALLAAGLPVEERLSALRSRFQGSKLAALLLGLLLLPSSASAAADMPTPDLLQDLRSRLLRPADCEPECASIPRLRLEAAGDTLRARLEVAAGASSGIPLPGGAQAWTPSVVLLDGSPAKGLLRSSDGQLYLPVGPGVHQVLLEGALPDRETVEIPLPLKPRRVEVQASGWGVDGVREDGVAEENIQLTRLRAAQRGPSDSLQGGALPPFLSVTRELQLGLSWEVRTVVSRLTPLGGAVVVEIPLLPGESVTSPDVRVEKGKVKLSMGPQVAHAAWTSVLSETPSLKLQASDKVQWAEVWRLEASPIWHVVPEGIPVIHAVDSSGGRRREWRPWPGESVALALSRPEGVPGQTLTIERSAMTVSPGLRATDVRLDLGFRSSLGGQHALTLPEGAELQSITVDGAAQPVRQEKNVVTVPVLPGSHQVSLSWRQADGVSLFYRSPAVALGLKSVNSTVSLNVPRDRWVLLLGGPRLGPAVLFWSVLTVMLLVSFGLSRVPLTPLRTRDWFLLCVGLSQVPVAVAAIVAGWLLALGARKKTELEEPWRFDLVQVVLAGWTVVALGCLLAAIRQGLLGQPDMQISGNGSTAFSLQWYQDRAGAVLPTPWLVSLPRMVYRLAMLAWALWIASSLVAWLRWGWTCINERGLWKTLRPKVLPPPPAGPAVPPPPAAPKK